MVASVAIVVVDHCATSRRSVDRCEVCRSRGGMSPQCSIGYPYGKSKLILKDMCSYNKDMK